MPKFSSLQTHFHNYEKYLHHDSSTNCIKEMMKGEKTKKGEKKNGDGKTGIVVIRFLREALAKPDWKTNDLMKRIVDKGFEVLSEKHENHKLSSSISKKFLEIKPGYENAVAKQASATDKVTQALPLPPVAPQQPEVPKQVDPARAAENAQLAQEAQRAKDVAAALKAQEERRRAVEQAQRRRAAEDERHMDDTINASLEFIRSERVARAMAPAPRTAAESKQILSKLFYEAMQGTKNQLISKDIHSAEDIADTMGDSYLAMIDLSLLRLIENAVKVGEDIFIFGLRNNEALKISNEEPFTSFQQTFSTLYDRYMTLNTSKQRTLLEQLVSYKAGEGALVETNPTVKNVFLGFASVQIEIDQNLINQLAAGPAAEGDVTYNFRKLFTD